ncbi:MAG: tetratricopeptide repeat protein [Gemmatimonadaceae bacterium]
MKSTLMVALLAVLSSTPRAVVAQGQSLAEMSAIDARSAEAPEQWIARGHELYAAGRYRESIAAFERALQLRADAGADGAWNVSRAYAQLDNRKQALRWLTHARQLGFRNEQAIRDEPAFDKYRNDAVFRELAIPSACMGCRTTPTRPSASA